MDQQEIIQKAVKGKFKGHQTLNSKVALNYPSAMERQYRGITDAYMKIVNQVVSEHLPKIQAAAADERKARTRADGVDDLMTTIQSVFGVMRDDLEERLGKFDLYGKLKELSELTTKLSIRQWKRVVSQTLGLDIFDDYYSGQFYQEMLDYWVSQNVALIKTIPQETLGGMREIVYEGYRNGRTTTAILKEIQRTYSTNKKHARLIARDQMAKLNADLTQRQQTDAGVEEYKWSDSRDGRVRPRHKHLNGKTFRWDDPPVVDTKTGRRCHPGQDYQCRCVALPVFNIKTLNIPANPKK